MRYGNLKALTFEELQYIKNNYEFDLRDEYIYVVKKGYNRITAHKIGEPFALSTKLRKINIHPKAVNLWIESYKDKGYSLIEIQNVLNTLVVTYQDITTENVEAKLKKLNKGEI